MTQLNFLPQFPLDASPLALFGLLLLAGVIGGELVRRPIRPPSMLERNPASTERVVKPHAPCVRQNGVDG